jgi:hypothetical protein
MRSVGIFLIAVALLASIVGMLGYVAHHPVEIWNWYDLNAIRNILSGSYLLMGNLDLSTPGYQELASETANQGKGWQPIGTRNATFTGTFDGQGYEIRDSFINRPDEDYVGLFWRVGQKGAIRNIGMVNTTVTGGMFAGALVGWNQGTVDDSYSRGSMTGDAFVGGLVGWNDGTVSNSYSNASVIGNRCVGGLVGTNEFAVRNSWSDGTVTGSMGVGGLVGHNGYGAVGNSYSDATVTGNGSVGGLVGSSDGTVFGSYSIGSVSGNDTIGGLVGLESHMASSYPGGVTNSFWDTETSGQATSDGGEGKTSAEMKSIATFSGAGWNIVAVADRSTHNSSYIWNIVDNVTYPLLSWFLCCPQGPPAQMTTTTTPSGYLELTVLPAEVCANVGEPVEIRCSIYCLINTVVEVGSVDVLLFDYYGSMIREQAMTKDSYWSAYTVYRIVGYEAYYKIKINFTIRGGGKYSEHGAYSFPIVVKK